MDVYTWVIFLYVGGTLAVGWFLLNEVRHAGHRRTDKHVGPTYWGTYTGAQFDSAKTIALAEYKHDEELEGLCGASGKAAKGGRV